MRRNEIHEFSETDTCDERGGNTAEEFSLGNVQANPTIAYRNSEW
jgi:hypothetical protein